MSIATGPGATALDVLFTGIRQRLRAGGILAETELLSAACLLSLGRAETQRDYWGLLREFAAAWLAGAAAPPRPLLGEAAAIHRFLRDTPFAAIRHIRRRDPHLWTLCLHVVRQDGAWFACSGSHAGLLLANGRGDTAEAALARMDDADAAAPVLDGILADIRAGLHANATGLVPEISVLFDNGRPIDQSVAIARFDRLMEGLRQPAPLTMHQNRLSCFFDPRIFPAVAGAGACDFFAAHEHDLRAEALRRGASSVEAVYLPEHGPADHTEALLRLKRSVRSAAAWRPAPRLPGLVQVFVSLELEKRRWIEQEEALLACFHAMAAQGLRPAIVLNGMTGVIFEAETRELMAHFAQIERHEQAAMARWRQALPPGTPIRYLGGQDLLRKTAEIAACDVFLAPGGTAALLALLADVPGAYYSHPALQPHFRSMLEGFPLGAAICSRSVRTAGAVPGVMEYDWSGVAGCSYSIAVPDFLREALPALAARRCIPV